MKCPECEKEMRWVGDQTVDEDIVQYVHDCSDCDIEVIKTKKVIY
jgi:hypothetical protein